MARSQVAPTLLAALALGSLGACRRPYQVGDHVLVEEKGDELPAVVVAVEGPSRLRVHFDGYGDDWDETVPGTRIRGRYEGAVVPPSAKTRGRPGASASASASAAPLVGIYRPGDRLRVEWRGSVYGATVVGVVDADHYRVHYDAYGPEWDETVPLARIQRR